MTSTDALIIDNRGNHGGDPATVAWYVSYLSTGPAYQVNTIHWRANNRNDELKTTELGELSYGTSKPVFVLTSSGTASGGEGLTYDLQALKRAVIVGEVTLGGAHTVGPELLGHHFVVNMPKGEAISAVTGTNWEGVGVKPDIPVPAADALTKARTLAVDRLIADTSDPPTRAALEALAMKLESEAEAQSPAATRLANEQIIGTYTQNISPDPPITILEKDGQLIQRIDGYPDRPLTYQAGNRYKRGAGLEMQAGAHDWAISRSAPNEVSP
jgi:C-terminal processing protease CtpA/Prc